VLFRSIDLGTCNCAASVWDSTRGRPKVLQLGLAATPRKGKVGRILPSVVVLFNDSKSATHTTIIPNVHSWIGQTAIAVQQKQQDTAKATVTSVKRLLGLKDPQDPLLQSLPMEITICASNQVWIHLQPLDSNTPIQVTPVQIIALLLSEIKGQAETYLAKNMKKKHMIVPGQSSNVSNAVIGVPAFFSSRQRQWMVEACRLAHFTGSIYTIMESTAASMAYGLFVSVATRRIIMVLDMGGGTTDITISQLEPTKEWTVIATLGDRQLGGDDMDVAILDVVTKKLGLTTKELSREQTRILLSDCRMAKEDLCGTYEKPAVSSVRIKFDTTQSIVLDQDEMNIAISPWIQQCRRLILRALQESGESHMDDVVLVGGATRVPAVRKMVQDLVPWCELCTSLSPDTAVAQGAAIQAAILSQLVPISEIQSCMMLDALPHAIGVKIGNNSFVPILQKDMPLPAMGYATFELADAKQAGVTVVAVEDIGGDTFELVGEFTFLLRRLTEKECNQLDHGKRTVDIGMTMETSGKFICSIFDKTDPEHLRKRQKYQKLKEAGGELGYAEIINDDDGLPLSLMVGCILLFLLYIGVKLAFNEPDETSQIL